MKPRYSKSFREKMVRRMLGSSAASANSLAKEVGVHQSTLSRWLREAHHAGMVAKEEQAPRQVNGAARSAEDKLQLVMAAEAVPPEELGAWLRREGVHESELLAWRAAVKQAAMAALSGTAPEKSHSTEVRRIKELERELNRKDKALAETAALLVLAKKAKALLGDVDDDTDNRSAK